MTDVTSVAVMGVVWSLSRATWLVMTVPTGSTLSTSTKMSMDSEWSTGSTGKVHTLSPLSGSGLAVKNETLGSYNSVTVAEVAFSLPLFVITMV